MTKKYGIFSEKQAKVGGIVLYESVDGKKVFVTHVSDQPGCPGCKWDDKKDVGEIIRFIQRVSKGDLPEPTRLREKLRTIRLKKGGE